MTGSILGRVSALALSVAAFAACGDNGVVSPDAPPTIDTPPPAPAVLTLTAGTNYGSVTIGETSPTMMFTVGNSGASTSGAITASVIGSGSSDFTIESNTCGTLDKSATCVIAVSFHPATAGAKTASLTVTANPGNTVTASLDGTGRNPGQLSISPTGNQNLGSSVVGTASTTTATFTVKNDGQTPTTALNVAPGGTNAADFAVSANTCTAALQPSSTCSFTVTFTPAAVGSRSALFDVTATTGGTITAAVSGTGLAAAQLDITPALQPFGSVIVNQSSSDVTFTVKNIGGVPTSVVSHTITGDSTQFPLVSSDCTAVLAPNATCSIIRHFTPTSAGAKQATITVTATTGGSDTATLLGDAVPPGQLNFIAPTPLPYNFADQTVGSASSPQTFTVRNDGGSASGVLTAAKAGTNPADFTIVAGSDGCTGTNLAAGSSCNIAIQFTPATAGPKSISLTVTGGASVATAGITGNAIDAAKLDLTPATQDFGSIGVNTFTSNVTFTVKNIGGQPTSVAPSVVVGGTNATQFETSNNQCVAVLAPGDTCNVDVRFHPTIVGMDTATLTATAGTATDVSTLFGNAVNPAALVVQGGTSFLHFNTVNIGDTSAGQTLTLINNGTETTGQIDFTVNGLNAADYTVTDTCDTLAAGLTCQVTITFHPSVRGAYSNSLAITSNPGGNIQVALDGTGRSRYEITGTVNGGLTIAGGSHDFGTAIVNTSAPGSATFTVKNNTLTTGNLTLTPSFAGQFNVTANTCTSSLASTATTGTLAAGTSCDVTVNFVPTSTGTKLGSLTYSFGAGAINTQTVNLTGLGVDSLILRSTDNTPTGAQNITQDFGSIAVGLTHDETIVVVNPANSPNTGTINVSINNGPFQIIANGCAGLSLSGGNNCSIVVRFIPTTVGAAPAATLTVTGTNMSAGGTAKATLTGTGLNGATVTVNQNTLAFGSVHSGDTADLTLTVSNPAASATTGTLVITNPAAPYALLAPTGSDCTAATTLAAGATCTVRVRYSPTGNAGFGSQNGSFSVSASPGGTKTVQLTGTKVSSISVTPASYDFGPQDQGSTTNHDFVVQNDSGHLVSVTMAVLQNNTGGAQFAVITNGCTASIAVAGTCTITVRFAPAVGGGATNLSADLSVTAADGVGTSSITAHRRSSAAVAFTEAFGAGSPYNFGSVLEGENGTTRAFVLKNSGETTAAAITAITNNNANNYTVTTDCVGKALAFNDTCNVTVQFTPAGTSNNSQQNAAIGATGPTVTAINLTGRSVDTGGFVLTPARATYADTQTGDTSAAQTFTLLNTGGAAQTYNSIVLRTASNVGGGLVTAQYSFAAGGTCVTAGGSLNAGEACTVNVAFSPTLSMTGPNERFLVVDGPGTNDPYADLNGVELSPAQITFTGSTSPLAFGNTPTGTSSTALTITVNNIGGLPSGAITISALGGNDPTQFSIASTTCSGPLAGQSNCAINVIFNPTAVGSKTANFAVNATPGLSSAAVYQLSGTGVLNADIGITPTAPQIDPQATAAAPRAVGAGFTTGVSFTINNGGNFVTGPLSITLGGANPGDFQTTGTCVNGAPLMNGSSCTVIVQFNPTAIGTRSTTLSVSGTPGGTQTASVTAFSRAAVSANVATDSTFTSAVGGTSSVHMFTFTNGAAVATGLLNVTLTGANPDEFVIDSNTCSGVAVAAAGNCSVSVRLVPQGTGARSATLTVSGTPGDSATVALSGTAP
ncbi:MAG TPA: choice-of-anchor D domain-containing protein [Kofleriaceae bacterium]|jgi:hypothetical protein